MKILYVDCDKCDAQICSCKDLELSPAEKIAALTAALAELGVTVPQWEPIDWQKQCDELKAQVERLTVKKGGDHE